MCVASEDPMLVLVNDHYAESIIKGVPTWYDAIEVHGVVNLNEEDDPEGTYYVIDDENPELYSVYLHCTEGGIESVGDFSKHAMAMEYAEELSSQYQWPVSNCCSCED
ncbi:hypothetical protein [Cellvibrio sp. QJXJ]|uniref:hypothetical protein n=1 Tax=Cellvibrio sp. QJXJ TaxID=2964606 RepID=UPI0021C47EB6|nr:hypothetical protein [Cellvibrio sp. QJXJ]UUA74248.1 hypothetical protein NNX04_07355 [Cellvibrio sp. QJXJ]